MTAYELFSNIREAYSQEFRERKRKDKDKGENPYKSMRREMGLPD
jgi:hypothetical protein